MFRLWPVAMSRRTFGQTVVGEVHRDAGPQGTAGFALDGGQLAAHLFHLAGGGGAVEQHLFACRREADALPRAQDDLHPQLLFQRLDALGKCRLGHVQFVRCVGDVARLVQRVQQLVIFFVHRSSPPIALYFSYHSCLRFIAALFAQIPYLLFIIQQITANEKGDIRLDFPESPFQDVHFFSADGRSFSRSTENAVLFSFLPEKSVKVQFIG